MLYDLLLRPLAFVVLSIVFRLLGGYRVEGRGNVPKRGAVIIAPNHLSHADPPLVGIAAPRGVWFMATTELFGVRVFGALARIYRAIPIRQDSPDRAALRRVERLLGGGAAVVIFPEGHESLDGRLLPLQGGTALLAIRTGTPILPVGIVGTPAMLPARSTRPRRAPAPAVVRFGRPIDAVELAGGRKGRGAVEHATRLLASALRDLTPELNGPEAVHAVTSRGEGIGPHPGEA
ncbi:MAG TPA: lysophospholipid acyltransferase family protein [Chthonomonadales bacterium]|nr:lysophospholipid acyltransferase family protein [Chthonomonadales bacterium]